MTGLSRAGRGPKLAKALAQIAMLRAIVTESAPHLCLFCESGARRLRVADITQNAIDCQQCGCYTISIVLDQRLRRFRSTHYLKKMMLRRLERANARGNRFDIDTGLETPLESLA